MALLLGARVMPHIVFLKVVRREGSLGGCALKEQYYPERGNGCSVLALSQCASRMPGALGAAALVPGAAGWEAREGGAQHASQAWV